MRLDKLIDVVLVAVLVVFSASYAHAEEFSARLNGFEELGAQNNETGAILSNGTGTLRLSLDKNASAATFTLTFSDVGTTPPKTGTVTQAHIHFGKVHSAGGVMVFFCSNLGNGPAGTQACPLNSGTVTGTFTSASVVAIPGQNVNAGDCEGTARRRPGCARAGPTRPLRPRSGRVTAKVSRNIGLRVLGHDGHYFKRALPEHRKRPIPSRRSPCS